MATTTRTQSGYEHRLRELVRTTQDVNRAVQYGVPRSTARGWLSTPSAQVVTAEALNMDATQLNALKNRKTDWKMATACRSRCCETANPTGMHQDEQTVGRALSYAAFIKYLIRR